MNHVHDSQETTPKHEAWVKLCQCIGTDNAWAIGQYLRAVIADELPNIAKAVLNHPLDKLGDPIECDTFAEALPPQPVAAGDVPEWFGGAVRGRLFASDDTLRRIWAEVEYEISRRVVEVSADRDKWIERAGEHAKTIGEQAKRIAFLDEQCSLNLKAYHEMTKDRDSWQTLHDRRTNELNAEMDAKEATQKQLAAAQAEVSRLKDMSNFEERANAWSLVWKTCNEVGMDSFKCNEYSGQGMAVAFIKHLASEVSRLTRPVEGVDWGALAVDFANMRGHGNNYRRILDYIIKPRFDAERNARESAERERDELREFVKAKYFWQSDDRLTKKVCTDNRHWPVTNEDIDKGLSAYRAEKGKVPQ